MKKIIKIVAVFFFSSTFGFQSFVMARPTPLPSSFIQESEIQTLLQNWQRTRSKELKKMVERAVFFEQMILSEFKKEKIPEHFFHIVFLRSGFENKLFPKKDDQNGLWLLNESISKRYGLKINAEVDERLDPIRSTQVVARYLNDLKLVFQDWDLVWLGFFIGEKKLLTVLMNSSSRQLKDILNSTQISKEIKNHYSEFLAYGKFYDENKGKFPKKKWSQLALKPVPHSQGAPLFQVSKELNVPYKKLLELNPHLYKQKMPYTEKDYALWVSK